MHSPKSICGVDSEGIVCTATLAAGTEDISNGDLVEDMMTFLMTGLGMWMRQMKQMKVLGVLREM